MELNPLAAKFIQNVTRYRCFQGTEAGPTDTRSYYILRSYSQRRETDEQLTPASQLSSTSWECKTASW